MTFYEKSVFFSFFYFDPRVIWGGFRHPESIFRYLKIKILWKSEFVFWPQNQFFRLKKGNRNRNEPEPVWTGTGIQRSGYEPNRTEPWASCTIRSIHHITKIDESLKKKEFFWWNCFSCVPGHLENPFWLCWRSKSYKCFGFASPSAFLICFVNRKRWLFL